MLLPVLPEAFVLVAVGPGEEGLAAGSVLGAHGAGAGDEGDGVAAAAAVADDLRTEEDESREFSTIESEEIDGSPRK